MHPPAMITRSPPVSEMRIISVWQLFVTSSFGHLDFGDAKGFENNSQNPADMNDGGNEFWNGGFGGGNTNMGGDDEFNANNENFPAQAEQDAMGMGDFNEGKGGQKPKMGHAFEAPLSEEEEQRIQQIEAEQQQRQRSLQLKEEEEYKNKKDRQSDARNELDNWYEQKNNERQSKRKQNKEEEWAYLQTREEHKKSKNPWEKIIDNVEINPNKYLGNKDVTRMRQAMLARKGDLKEGRK